MTPRTVACQASLSYTINQTLLKFMLFESVILSNHHILCHPLFVLSSIFLRIRIIRVVSSAYLRLLIFLLVILIPACDSSSLTFHMMYSAQKLNKPGDNIQPWRTLLIWKQSVVPCPVLTVASQPAYRFLKRQVRWSGISISWIFYILLWPTQSKALA